MTSSTPLDGSGAGSFSIPEIVQLAGEGSIRVPTFQRHFAWQAKDVRSLFDSIYRGFPVGTLLLWRHDAEQGKVKLGPIEFDVPHSAGAYYVVDGQQRITSLFAALSTRHPKVEDRFNVYFDLEKEKFINPSHGRVPTRAIPVREALETRTLLQWLRNHGDDLEPDDYDLADRLGGALRDYKIPAYIVAGNDQELLREVFDRVNSAGKPISRAQVFHALFVGGDEPSSPASVVENLSRLGFGSFDEGRIVQSVLGIRGGDVQRDIRAEFEDGTSPSDWFDHAERALERTIEFFKNEGVPHQLVMPNTLPIPVLATFFHLHPDPQPWIRRLLSRWLWRGWVHGFGREGGQTPVLRRAIRSIHPELHDPSAAPDEFGAVKRLLDFTPDQPAPDLSLEGFNARYANSRIILLSLASLRPLNEMGNPVNLSQEYEKFGTDAATVIVSGMRSFAAARSYWPVESRSLSEVRDPKILESHLIDSVAADQLVRDDLVSFLIHRASLMKGQVHQFLDSRLEPGRSIRPPLREITGDETEDD